MADDKTYSYMYSPKDVPSSGNLYQEGAGPLPYAPPGVVQFGTYPEPPEGYKQYQKADGENIRSYDVGTGPHPNVGPGMIPRGYDVPPPPPLRTPERTMRPPTPTPPSMQSAGYSRDYDRMVSHLDPRYSGLGLATQQEKAIGGAFTGRTQESIQKQFEMRRMQQGGEQYDTLESYAMDKFNSIPKMDLTEFQDIMENDFGVHDPIKAFSKSPLAPSIQDMQERYDATLPPQPKHSLTAARQAANLQAAGGSGYTPGAYPTPPTPTPPQSVASPQPARRVETDPRELGYNQPSRRVETDPRELGYSKKEDSMDPRDSASSLYAYSKPKASFKSKFSPEEIQTAGKEIANRDKHLRDMPGESQPPGFSPKTQEIANFIKTSSKTLEEGGDIDPEDSDAGINTFGGFLSALGAAFGSYATKGTTFGMITNALGLQPASLQAAIDKAWFNANKNYFSSAQEAADYAAEMGQASLATKASGIDVTGHEPSQRHQENIHFDYVNSVAEVAAEEANAAVAAAAQDPNNPNAQAAAEAAVANADAAAADAAAAGEAAGIGEFGGGEYSGGMKHGGRIRKYQDGTTDVGSLEPRIEPSRGVSLPGMDVINDPKAGPPSDLDDKVPAIAKEGDVVFPPESVEIMGLLNMNDMIKAALGLALEVGAVVPPDIDPNEKVPVRLTNGEVIIPKVVADAVGKERVEEIINKGLKLRAQREEQAQAQQQAAPQAAPPMPQGLKEGSSGIKKQMDKILRGVTVDLPGEALDFNVGWDRYDDVEGIIDIAKKVGAVLGNPTDGTNLMLETAAVESGMGQTDRDINRASGEGFTIGPWQVTTTALNDINSRVGDPYHKGMKRNIDKFKQHEWAKDIPFGKVTEDDLKDPTTNAVYARLYYTLKEGDIPDTPEGRAEYWAKKYNTPEDIHGTPALYMKKLKEARKAGYIK